MTLSRCIPALYRWHNPQNVSAKFLAVRILPALYWLVNDWSIPNQCDSDARLLELAGEVAAAEMARSK